MGSETVRRERLVLWVLLTALQTTLSTAAWTSDGYGSLTACATDTCATSEGELQLKLAGLVEMDSDGTTISTAPDFTTSIDFEFGTETYEEIPSTATTGYSSISYRNYSAPLAHDNAVSSSGSGFDYAQFSCFVSDYPTDVDPLVYPAGSIEFKYSIESWVARHTDNRFELSLYLSQLTGSTRVGDLTSVYKTDALRVFVGTEAFVELPLRTLESFPVNVWFDAPSDILRISLPAADTVSYSFLFVRNPLSTSLDSPILAPLSRTWTSAGTGDISTCSEPMDDHCPGGLNVNLNFDAMQERDSSGAVVNEVAGFSGSSAFAFTDTESPVLMSADGITYRTMTKRSFTAAIPQSGSDTPYVPIDVASSTDPIFSCNVDEYSEDMSVVDYAAGSLGITCSISGWSFASSANRLVLSMSIAVAAGEDLVDPDSLYETDLSPDLLRLHLGSPQVYLDLDLRVQDMGSATVLDATATVVSISAGVAQVEVSLPPASDQSYSFTLVRPPSSVQGTTDTGTSWSGSGTIWTPSWTTDIYDSGSVSTCFEPVDGECVEDVNITIGLVFLREVANTDRSTAVASVFEFTAGPYVYDDPVTWDVTAADGITMSTVGMRSFSASIPNDEVTPPYAGNATSGDPQMTCTVTDYPADLDVLNYPAGSLQLEFSFQNWGFQNVTDNLLEFAFSINVDTTYDMVLKETDSTNSLRIQLGPESYLDLPKYGMEWESGQQVGAEVYSMNKEVTYTQMRVYLPANNVGLSYIFTLARPPLSLQSTTNGETPTPTPMPSSSSSSGTTYTATWVTNSSDIGSVLTCLEPVDDQCASYNDFAFYLKNLREVAADGVTEVVSVLGFSEGPFVFGDSVNWTVLASDGMTMSTIGYRYFDASIPDNGTARPYPTDIFGSDPMMTCTVYDYPSDLDLSYPAGSLFFEYTFQNWGFQDTVNNWLEFTFEVYVDPTYETVLTKADQWSNWRLYLSANSFLDLSMTADDWGTGQLVNVEVSLMNVYAGYAEVRVLFPASISGIAYRLTLARPPLSLQNTSVGTPMPSLESNWTLTWMTDSNGFGTVSTCSEPVDDQCTDPLDIKLSLVSLWELSADQLEWLAGVAGFANGPYMFEDPIFWEGTAADGTTAGIVGDRFFASYIPNDGMTTPYTKNGSSNHSTFSCSVADFSSDVPESRGGSLSVSYRFLDWMFQDPVNNWLRFTFSVSVNTTYELALVESEIGNNLRVQLTESAFLDLPKLGYDARIDQYIDVQVNVSYKTEGYAEITVLFPAGYGAPMYNFLLTRPPLSLQTTDVWTPMPSSGTTNTFTWMTNSSDIGSVLTCFEPVDGQCANYSDFVFYLKNLREVAADGVTEVVSVLGFSEGPFVFGDKRSWDELAADGVTMTTIDFRSFETSIPDNGTARPYVQDMLGTDPRMQCAMIDYPSGFDLNYPSGSLAFQYTFLDWGFRDVLSNWLEFTFEVHVDPSYEPVLTKADEWSNWRLQLNEVFFLDLSMTADVWGGERPSSVQVSLLSAKAGYAEVKVLLPASMSGIAYRLTLARPPFSLQNTSVGSSSDTTWTPTWMTDFYDGGSVSTCSEPVNGQCTGSQNILVYLRELREVKADGITEVASVLGFSGGPYVFSDPESYDVLAPDYTKLGTIGYRYFGASIPNNGTATPYSADGFTTDPQMWCQVTEYSSDLNVGDYPAGSLQFDYAFQQWSFRDTLNLLAFTFAVSIDTGYEVSVIDSDTSTSLRIQVSANAFLDLPKYAVNWEVGELVGAYPYISYYNSYNYVEVTVLLPASLNGLVYSFKLVRPPLSLIYQPTTSTNPPMAAPAPTATTVSTYIPPRSALHFFPGGFELCSTATCDPGDSSMLSLTLDRLGVGSQLVNLTSSSSSSSYTPEFVGMTFLVEISDFKTTDELRFARDPQYIDSEYPYRLLLLEIPRAGGEATAYGNFGRFLEVSGLENGPEMMSMAAPVYVVLAVAHLPANETATSGEANQTDVAAPKGSARLKVFLFNANNGTMLSNGTETLSFFLSGFQRGAMLSYANTSTQANVTRITLLSDSGLADKATEEVYLECPNYVKVDGVSTKIEEVGAVVYSSGEYAGLIQFWIRIPRVQTSWMVEYQCILVATDSSTASAVGGSPSASGSGGPEPPTTSRDGRPRTTKMKVGSRGEFGLCFDPSCAEDSPAVSVGFSGLGSRLGSKLPRFEGAAAFAFRDPTLEVDNGTERWSTSFQAIVPQSKLQAPRAFTPGSSPPAKGEGALFSVGVDQYLTPGQTSNGDQIVDVPRGGLKFAVNISGWQFGGLDDALELNFTLSAESLFPNSSSSSGVELNVTRADVGTDGNLTRVWLGDSTQPFLDVPLVAVVDGVTTRVNVSVSLSEEDPLDVVFAMTFPPFALSLYYDPVLASQTLVDQDVKITYVNHRRKHGSSQFQVSQTAGIPLFVALVLVVLASILHCFQTTPLSVEFPKEKP